MNYQTTQEVFAAAIEKPCEESIEQVERIKDIHEYTRLYPGDALWAVKHVPDLLTDDLIDLFDYCIKAKPWDALEYVSDRLTDEQFDYCIKAEPWNALELVSDRLTPEQFDYCINESPWAALKYVLDRLTPEQVEECRRLCR